MEIRPDGWDPASQPTFWINHISRLLMHEFEARLRPLGFGMAYLPVVILLEEQGPLLQKHLVEAIRVEQPTMAALLSRMERDGIVIKTPHPSDRRSSHFALSPEARQRVPEAKRVLEEIADRALCGLAPNEKSDLFAMLRRIAANLGEERAAFPAPVVPQT